MDSELDVAAVNERTQAHLAALRKERPHKPLVILDCDRCTDRICEVP